MNFDFSDDQKYLRDEARKFLEAQCTIAEVRKVLDDDTLGHNAEVWQKVVEMGWLGAAIPEEYGGLGLGMLELCVIAEELGRVLAPVPFSSSAYYFAEAVKLAGSEDQKTALLPGIADGSFIGCLATTEGPGAISESAIRAQFRDGKLTGTKLPVTDGDIATHAVVLAKDGGASCLVVVDLRQDGVSRKTLKTIEPTRGHAEIAFDAAPAELLSSGAGNGMVALDQILNRAAVLLAFEQLGGASRCLEMATEYAKERQAFGRPIGGNQAIKHKLADMYVKNEVARSNAYYGAWALSTNAAELPEAAAAARVAASEAYWYASKENIQTHGGMGFTWEVDCHLYYRRAKLLAVQAGSPAVWKEKLVTALEAKNAA
ncbi:Acyl-CoA dehydrogenase [Parasphingorhabdus marina DSM 22363]|uniref:Acyl-CoA dehydrogenase n=1 Tax=Parasphingorhabdus marina DSM 22363 TaxID=1123272 RepID=A0A1N6CMP1_9SPHN|nr:acyl-CoA dehydrogenase family protein [Parasphingorhabdus marina]SIN59823.1 Acyl-CoA dehydrogenase [Parasphingorhabdus marina DSM 22363]